jgi:8-oxo-dGTP pyrophosphatase MutT (NUDIX family)
METKKDFSCGGIAWDPKEKKTLLVNVENLSGQKVWTFPKGHPEANETDEQAAMREVLEETGWTCEVLKPMTDVEYFYVHDGTRFQKTVRWFFMKPIAKTGKFWEHEVVEVRWVSIKEAESMISYESDQKLLKELIKLAS